MPTTTEAATETKAKRAPRLRRTFTVTRLSSNNAWERMTWRVGDQKQDRWPIEDYPADEETLRGLLKDRWGSGTYQCIFQADGQLAAGRSARMHIDDPTAPPKPAYPNPPIAEPPPAPPQQHPQGLDAAQAMMMQLAGPHGGSLLLAMNMFQQMQAIARDERRMAAHEAELRIKLAQQDLEASRERERQFLQAGMQQQQTYFQQVLELKRSGEEPAGVAELRNQLAELGQLVEDAQDQPEGGDSAMPAWVQTFMPMAQQALSTFNTLVQTKQQPPAQTWGGSPAPHNQQQWTAPQQQQQQWAPPQPEQSPWQAQAEPRGAPHVPPTSPDGSD